MIRLVDDFTLLIYIGIGAVVGLAAGYFFYRRPKPASVRLVAREPTGEVTLKSVSIDELDRSRREMRALMVERDLLSSALMKIYEAETQGKITRGERESIAKRYSDQIRAIEGKLKDSELIVEVGELEKLREELVSLFREKVENIEARLELARERLQAIKPEIVLPPKKEAAQVEELEKVVERRARAQESEAERRVKQLKEEVMDALTKLEQIDLEKKPREKG